MSCETEREEPPVALQPFQNIHVEVKDMEGRNLLSNESDAFKDEEIEVRFVKGGKPYFNANMTNNPRGFSVKRTDDSPYLKLSLSEITKKAIRDWQILTIWNWDLSYTERKCRKEHQGALWDQ